MTTNLTPAPDTDVTLSVTNDAYDAAIALTRLADGTHDATDKRAAVSSWRRAATIATTSRKYDDAITFAREARELSTAWGIPA